MNGFEDELRGRLAAHAGAMSVRRDWDDLTDRMGRSARRTKRALCLALTLTVCLAVVGVVIARRSTGPPPARKSHKTASPAKRTAPADRVVATHFAVPMISAANGR